MANPATTHEPITVVIIDDDKDVRTVFVDLATDDERFQVLGSFSSAKAGVEFVADTPVDAIVIDNHMRALTGFAALPQLRDSCPDACLTLWSSGAVSADDAVANGADVVLEKLVTPTQLFDVVADWVTESRRQRHHRGCRGA